MNELVSIIIPTYNGLPWLIDAIESSINQSYKNFEIILIDDGSTDSTRQIVKDRYGDKIEYYFQVNQGLSSARNFGLEKANGDYIQFLDSDDLIPIEKIKTQISFLKENKEIDIVYSQCKTFYKNDIGSLKDWRKKQTYKNGNLFIPLLKKSFILPHMPLSRTKVLIDSGGYDNDMNSCIDYDFWLRVAFRGTNFYFLDDGNFVYYRILNDSLSSSSLEFSKNGLYSLKKLKNEVKKFSKEEIKIYKSAIADWEFKIGRSNHEEGKYFRGLNKMFLSILRSENSRIYKIALLIFSSFTSIQNSDKILRIIKNKISFLYFFKN